MEEYATASEWHVMCTSGSLAGSESANGSFTATGSGRLRLASGTQAAA